MQVVTSAPASKASFFCVDDASTVNFDVLCDGFSRTPSSTTTCSTSAAAAETNEQAMRRTASVVRSESSYNFGRLRRDSVIIDPTLNDPKYPAVRVPFLQSPNVPARILDLGTLLFEIVAPASVNATLKQGANWRAGRSTCVFYSGLFAPLCENMTSTKPEVGLHCR